MERRPLPPPNWPLSSAFQAQTAGSEATLTSGGTCAPVSRPYVVRHQGKAWTTAWSPLFIRYLA